MTFARKSGGNVTPTTVKRRSGGAWTNVQTIKRRLSGAWVTVWNAYTAISSVTVTPNPSNVETVQAGSGAPLSLAVSGSLAVTASGGSGSYTYSTAFVSGTAMTVTNGNTANPTIYATCSRNQTISAVYRFTVSDGTSSAYLDVNVSRTYSWSSGA